MLADWLSSKLDNKSTLFVDLRGCKCKQVTDIFTSVRPDLAIVTENAVLIVELTICNETNLRSSKLYKENKYKDLDYFKTEIIADRNLVLTTCVLSVLGFLQFDNSVYRHLSIPLLDDNVANNIVKTAIQSPFDIYIHRDVENA